MIERAAFVKQLQQQSQDDVDFDIADLPRAGAGRNPTQLAGRDHGWLLARGTSA